MRAVKNTCARLDRGVQSMLYEPVDPDEKSRVAVLVMHFDIGELVPADGVMLQDSKRRTPRIAG